MENIGTEIKDQLSQKQSAVNSLSVPISIVIAGVIVAAAIIFTNKGGIGISSNAPGNNQQSPYSKEEIKAAEELLTIRDGDYVLGSANAPVTIIEFGDFECPFCAKFHNEARKNIIDSYVKTGKAKVVWRHFPISSIHPEAESASIASECAGEQGKFWEMHDLLFGGTQELGAKAYTAYAGSLKLNMAQFQGCVDQQKYVQKVRDEFNKGTMLGVSGTPTFFINGVQLVGAQPFSAFEQVIDSILKK